MSFLGDFHFIRPAWLLLAPVAAAIWWFQRQSLDPLGGWRRAIEAPLLEALVTGQRATNRYRGLALMAAWMLAVIAVAGPTWRPEPSPFADDPVPVMIVLRAGESMNQSDLIPSRMERARLKVEDFATERKGLPLGLVTYSGTAHLVLPPTRDTAVVATMSAEISPEIMPQPGDDLAAALQLAASTLGDSGGSLIVVADTATEAGDSVLAKIRNEYNVSIHFLAIARTDTPEEDAIRSVASALRADVTLMSNDNQDVRGLVRSIAQAPVSVQAAGAGVRWAESGWWLVPPIALLSLLSFRRVEHPPTKAATP